MITQLWLNFTKLVPCIIYNIYVRLLVNHTHNFRQNATHLSKDCLQHRNFTMTKITMLKNLSETFENGQEFLGYGRVETIVLAAYSVVMTFMGFTGI